MLSVRAATMSHRNIARCTIHESDSILSEHQSSQTSKQRSSDVNHPKNCHQSSRELAPEPLVGIWEPGGYFPIAYRSCIDGCTHRSKYISLRTLSTSLAPGCRSHTTGDLLCAVWLTRPILQLLSATPETLFMTTEILSAIGRTAHLYILIALPLKWQYESDMAQASYRKRHSSLKTFIQSRPGNRAKFKAYLPKEFRQNEFEFWEQIEELESSAHNMSPKMVVDNMERIYQQYIKSSAPRRVDINRYLKNQLANGLETLCQKPDVFRFETTEYVCILYRAAEDVLHILEVSAFRRFLSSHSLSSVPRHAREEKSMESDMLVS
eukprot:710431_1